MEAVAVVAVVAVVTVGLLSSLASFVLACAAVAQGSKLAKLSEDWRNKLLAETADWRNKLLVETARQVASKSEPKQPKTLHFYEEVRLEPVDAEEPPYMLEALAEESAKLARRGFELDSWKVSTVVVPEFTVGGLELGCSGAEAEGGVMPPQILHRCMAVFVQVGEPQSIVAGAICDN